MSIHIDHKPAQEIVRDYNELKNNKSFEVTPYSFSLSKKTIDYLKKDYSALERKTILYRNLIAPLDWLEYIFQERYVEALSEHCDSEECEEILGVLEDLRKAKWKIMHHYNLKKAHK